MDKTLFAEICDFITSLLGYAVATWLIYAGLTLGKDFFATQRYQAQYECHQTEETHGRVH